jgi:hypothetical protein
LETIILKLCKSRNKNSRVRTAATSVVAALGSEGGGVVVSGVFLSVEFILLGSTYADNINY